MKGSYALVLLLAEGTSLKVGQLGESHFPAGYYLYFGSALNSLEGRLSRHLSQEKKRHWHIDSLTEVSQIVQIWWTVDGRNQECCWTRRSLERNGISVPVSGFGSSDCRDCPAHLVCAPSWMDVQQVQQALALDSAKCGFGIANEFNDIHPQTPQSPVS